VQKQAHRAMRGLLSSPPWNLIWSILALTTAWHCWFASYNHDEIQHLHAAWLISAGQLPYRDFLENHHPTLWFLAAPIIARFGSVQWLVFAARAFDALCLLGLLAIFRRILARVHPGSSWKFPALLLLASFIFVRSTLEFRPDPLMNLMVYAGVLHWMAFLQEGDYRRALVSGVLFGLAAAILQKALVVLGLVCISAAFLIVLRLWRRERIRRQAMGAAVLIAAAAVPVSLLFAAMRSLGIFKDFWFWNYPFNRFFYLQADLPQHFSVLQNIGLNVLVDPVLWVAGATGAWLCIRDLLRRERLSPQDECWLVLLWIAVGYLAFLSLNRFPLDQYFIVPLPLVALFAAKALSAARTPRRQALLERSILCMPLILIGILLLHPSNRSQRNLQQFVLGRTSAAQTIFVPPAFNPVFRRDAAFFWYDGELISGAYAEYCRRVGSCPGDKLALDDQRWQSSPPAYVFLELPAYYPYRWSSRESSYHRTEIPRLWERERLAARAPPSRLGRKGER